MREINATYEQIRTQKNGGAAYERPSGGNPYGGGRGYGQGQNPFEEGPFAGGSGYDPFDIFNMFGGGYRQQQQQQHRPNSPRMQAVHNFIQNRQYAEALRVLSEIGERNAEWYYYSALAQAGAGNRVSAMNHAWEAVRREPGNDEYQALLEQFERGGFEYRQTGQSYGFDMSQTV